MKAALVLCGATGCGTFGFGSAPTPVTSSSATSARSTGAHGEIAQIDTRVRISASHVCDIAWKEERTAGHQAEAYHPLEKLNHVRRQREEEEAHTGPITMGILSGADDSQMQSRSLSNEIHRGLSPWMVGAAAVGAVETLLKATARVEGRVKGERREAVGVVRGAPCAQHVPYPNALVTLKLRAKEIPLGYTDEAGSLVVDLTEVLGAELDLEAGDAEVEIFVAGQPAGRAQLDVVVVELAERKMRVTHPVARAQAAPSRAADSNEPAPPR